MNDYLRLDKMPSEVVIKRNVFINKDFAYNRHLVFDTENVRDNCYIKDASADDVLDCPNCKRIAKYAGGGLLEE